MQFIRIGLSPLASISMQEKSFCKGVAYVIAMVAEFDEYTNDWLYLREGTVLPRSSFFLFILKHVHYQPVKIVLLELCFFWFLSFLTIETPLLTARPRYRRKGSRSSELSVGASLRAGGRLNLISVEPRGMLVPSLAPSRSVRESMQEVQVFQVCSYILFMAIL